MSRIKNVSGTTAVEIGGLFYKIGRFGRAWRLGESDWMPSSKSASEIRTAIAREEALMMVKAGLVPPPVKDYVPPKKAKKAGRKSKREHVLQALSNGPQTMRELRSKTLCSPTAIRSAIEALGSRVKAKSIVKVNAWTTRSTVTVWELVA